MAGSHVEEGHSKTDFQLGKIKKKRPTERQLFSRPAAFQAVSMLISICKNSRRMSSK